MRDEDELWNRYAPEPDAIEDFLARARGESDGEIYEFSWRMLRLLLSFLNWAEPETERQRDMYKGLWMGTRSIFDKFSKHYMARYGDWAVYERLMENRSKFSPQDDEEE